MTIEKAIKMIDEYLLEPNSIHKDWVEVLRLCKQALIDKLPKENKHCITMDNLRRHHDYAKRTYDEDYSEEMLSLRNDIIAFVNCAEDMIVRDVLYYRYVVGESWQSIATTFHNIATPDCYRRMSERYLKKCFGGHSKLKRKEK